MVFPGMSLTTGEGGAIAYRRRDLQQHSLTWCFSHLEPKAGDKWVGLGVAEECL